MTTGPIRQWNVLTPEVLDTRQEATVYTNIKTATPQLLELTGAAVGDRFAVPETSTSPFVLEANQDR